MKDLSLTTYFLVLEVHTQPHGLFVNQHRYAQDLIHQSELDDSTTIDTPLEINVKYQKDEGDLLEDPTI